MEAGIDYFAAVPSDPVTGWPLSGSYRAPKPLQEVGAADRVGLDLFGIGGHHRTDFPDPSAVAVQ